MAVEERFERKYKIEFEKDYEWVTRDPSGKELAYCTTCEVTITPTSSCLKTHSSSWRHQKNNYDIKTTGKRVPLRSKVPGRGSTWKKDYDLSRKFRDEWLEQFTWVKKKNDRLGYCPYCDIDLEPRARRLEDHQNTSKHQKNFTTGPPPPSIKSSKKKDLMDGMPALLDETDKSAATEKKRKSFRKRFKKLMFDELQHKEARKIKKKAKNDPKPKYVAEIIQAAPNEWSSEFPWVVMDEDEEKFPYCPFCIEFVEPTISSLRRHQELVKHRKKSRKPIVMETTGYSRKESDVLEQTEVAEDVDDDSTEIHTTVVVPAGTVIQSGLGMDVMDQASFFPISGTQDQYLQIIIQDTTSGDDQNVTDLGNSIEVTEPVNMTSDENGEPESSETIHLTTSDDRGAEMMDFDCIEYVADDENNTKPFKKRKNQHGRNIRIYKPINVSNDEIEIDQQPENENVQEEGPPKKRFTRRSIRLRKPNVWRVEDDDGDDDGIRVFLQEWLEEYPWVRKKTENDTDIAYCIICSRDMPAKAARLRLHDQSTIHKKNAEAALALSNKSSGEQLQPPKAHSTGKVETKPRYVCDLCDRRFAAQRNLYFHMKEHYEPDENTVAKDDSTAIEHIVEKNTHTYKLGEYNPNWQKIFPWLVKAEDNEWAFCILCSLPMEPRLHVIKAHMKHRRHIRFVSQQSNPRAFEMKPDVGGILEAEERRLSRRKRIPTTALGETFIGEDGKAKTKCPTCKKILVKTSFAVHWRIHEGVRPYKCTQCEWAFKQAYDLKHHVESIHNGIKPHQCEECGKEFTRKYTLKLHQKSHTGNKAHKCDVCQKGFITNSKLIEHYRTHTGERPFLCDYCGRSFRIKFDMMAHKQKAHIGIEAPKKSKLKPPAISDRMSQDDQDDEEESLETETVITHYVELKEEVSLELDHDDEIEVEVEDQQVHGFDAFEEVDMEDKTPQIVFLSDSDGNLI